MTLPEGQHVVAELGEIPPGSRKIVTVNGREIGIFNVKGTLYAIRNRCPHQGGPLCQGTIGGFVSSSAPGEYRYERAGEMIRCPWHQWEYDITTGQSWFDPARVRTRKYSVRVSAGAELVIDDDAQGADVDAEISQGAEADAAAPTGPAGLEPGPFVAETYPVSIDRDYVIVDLRR